MKKKRREKHNFKAIDLTGQHLRLKDHLCREVSRNERCGLLQVAYSVLPEYGKGHVVELHFEGVTISISNLVLHDNFVFFNEIDVNALYLSFLIKGEMLLKIGDVAEERPYVENESFMAYIERFRGGLKMYNNKAYKVVKIIVPQFFLKKYGFMEKSEFKSITDKKLMLPTTPSLYAALEILESEHGDGLVKRLFLEAKVLEVIALQMGNYKLMHKVNNKDKKLMNKMFLLKQYLKDNLSENYSIRELSEEVGVSENILKLEFKRVFNCTINQYFLNQKMKKAKTLLKNTEIPIYEIAEAVGYKNATHFSAAFKRVFNETPKAYRSKL
ncbi:helix-turn-helix transcriptional regulator [Aestuariivivens insulae]|uniref:helix-turn-helix transcriptional regulator n=1 Tax=Aestuariivivens insulae TaxID=1621988 RepID=UPI001F596D1C|nr:helix-turn-helix domain-containing protein [Aestuariivivens insulae]